MEAEALRQAERTGTPCKIQYLCKSSDQGSLFAKCAGPKAKEDKSRVGKKIEEWQKSRQLKR